jgi:hypothetical protein
MLHATALPRIRADAEPSALSPSRRFTAIFRKPGAARPCRLAGRAE